MNRKNVKRTSVVSSETLVANDPDQVKKMMAADDYLEGGAMILYHHDRPVGVVKCSDDEYDGVPTMNIGSLALIPKYQGKGFGRMLLRKALQFGLDQSY